MKTIKILIPLTGISKGTRQLKIETTGFIGEECRTASEAFAQALGSTVDEELKSEYYDVETRSEFLREGGGSGDTNG